MGRAAAIGAALLAWVGQASAAPTETVSLTLPRDVFKSAQVGAMPENVAVEDVSLEIDLSNFSKPRIEPFGIKHLRQMLTPELAKNFDLFLYISKAAHGPYAQHMYVLRKNAEGKFDLLYDWPVSTGRERSERNALGIERFTATLSGYYELDPDRMFADYRSVTWDEPMPHAMFFDAWYKGARVGLAIHATDEKENLGTRASAGCVRLSSKNAKNLFQLVSANYRGNVPRMAYDKETKSTRRDGALMRDPNGKLAFHAGYRVLVIIENFGGAEVATQ
ncbi:MAG TPA: L,D-transpeptidase [Rhizomicrobium sp.]|nr:L,D-transpeptidase [Rhizomicrobium sp.]